MDLKIQGKVIYPSDAEFCLRKDRVYNKRFTEFHPEMICTPSNTADVIEIVKYATRCNKKIVVRCGGHSMTGLSACKQGEILVDMTLMNRVQYDDEKSLALIDGGCLLVNVNFGLARYNKAIPVGDMGLVGISGLTLNGGFGALTNTVGLTLDHVEQIEIVTGKGALIANKETNADIFAVLKQGCSAGRYLGIITSFWFHTTSVPTQVLGGLARKKISSIASELSIWANYCIANPTKFIGCYLFGDSNEASAEFLYNYISMDTNEVNEKGLQNFLGQTPEINNYAEALNKLTPLLAEKECRMCSVELLFPSWNDDISIKIEGIWKTIRSFDFLQNKSIIFAHYAKPPQRNEMFWLQCIIGWDHQRDDTQALAVAENIRTAGREIMSQFKNLNTGWQLDRNLVRQVKEKVDPFNIFPQV